MDILVLLADADDSVDATGVPAAGSAVAVPIARVRSAPDPTAYGAGHRAGRGRGARDVVTLYGAAEADHLAVAIAAACEGRLAADPAPDAVRQLGVWADRGAVGDVAWRDRGTGQLVTRDVSISAAVIAGTAGRLLREHGRAIRQTVAGLAMAEWPEGARRGIHVSLGPVASPLAAVGNAAAGAAASSADAAGADDALLALLREADGYDDACNAGDAWI